MFKLTNVPEEMLSMEIENFVKSGYSNIRLTKQADGTWTIEGTDSTGPR